MFCKYLGGINVFWGVLIPAVNSIGSGLHLCTVWVGNIISLGLVCFMYFLQGILGFVGIYLGKSLAFGAPIAKFLQMSWCVNVFWGSADPGCEQHWVWPTLVYGGGCEHYKPGSDRYFVFSSKNFEAYQDLFNKISGQTQGGSCELNLNY